MTDTKLIRILKSLDTKDRRKFKEYVSSPYFNKHDRLIDLSSCILKRAPAFSEKNLNWETIFREVFPKEAPDRLKWNNLISDLTELLRGFIAVADFEKNNVRFHLHLLAGLRDKELSKDYELSLKDTTKLQEKTPYRDQVYYYNNYLIAAEYDNFFIKTEKRAQDDSLQLKVDNLDLFYLATKLKNSCEMVNRSTVIASDYQMRMLDDIMGFLGENIDHYSDYPAINIYYQILLTLRDVNNDEHYPRLKKALKEHANKFSSDEAREMYEYARNYCIRMANTGASEYLNELFEVYKLLLESELIIKGRNISPWDYKNIVSVSLRLKDFEWTKNFIQEYKGLLAEEFRENAYSYNLAAIDYNQGNYKDAMRLLQSVEFTDVYYSIDSKSMLLKIYYELDNEEALYYLIDSFSQYLRRNKLVSDFQKNAHMNRLKFVKKAFKLRQAQQEGDRQIGVKIEKLIKEIKMEKQIINRAWLVEKVSEVEQIALKKGR